MHLEGAGYEMPLQTLPWLFSFLSHYASSGTGTYEHVHTHKHKHTHTGARTHTQARMRNPAFHQWQKRLRRCRQYRRGRNAGRGRTEDPESTHLQDQAQFSEALLPWASVDDDDEVRRGGQITVVDEGRLGGGRPGL